MNISLSLAALQVLITMEWISHATGTFVTGVCRCKEVKKLVVALQVADVQCT